MTGTSELLEQLVAIDSVNPTLVPGGAGEVEIARFVAAWLEEHGLEVEYEELAPGRANVIGRARGSGGGRSLMLNAHLDTVALGGPDGSLAPRVEGRRLYGRGSYDMKGGLVAIMLAAARAVELELAGDVIVAAVADEEALSIGSERVAATVARRRRDRHRADRDATRDRAAGLRLARARDARVAPRTARATTSESTRSHAWARSSPRSTSSTSAYPRRRRARIRSSAADRCTPR